MDDAALVAQAQAGREDAFCALVERHKAKAMSIAWGMLGNFEEAKDASQEAFVKAYRALHGFRGDAAFATWLHRIVVNECQSVLRSRGRRQRWFWSPAPVTDEGAEAEDFLTLVPDTRSSVRDMAHDAEVARLLRGAIAHLSPRQRAVVTLRYLQGFSVEEVAQALGCATGTVKAQQARAMRHLRAQLNGVLEGHAT